jgi:hypothetical protein
MNYALQATYMLQPVCHTTCRKERFWRYDAAPRAVPVIFSQLYHQFYSYLIYLTQEPTNRKQHETYDVQYLSLAKKENLRTHSSDEIAPYKVREKIVEAEEADQRSAQRRTCFT